MNFASQNFSDTNLSQEKKLFRKNSKNILKKITGNFQKIKEDENSSLKWFTFEEALKASTEEWFVERIYPKLNEKVKRYFARR